MAHAKASTPAPRCRTSHKAALAEGREQGRAVRRYLEALEAHKPKRGRKRTPESMQKRLAAIEDKLADADPLNRLQLIQERLDLQAELAAAEHHGRPRRARGRVRRRGRRPYSERKGISYAAWRELGVDAAGAASEAGISRATLADRVEAPASRRRQQRRAASAAPAAVRRAEQRVAGPLGVGHEPDDVAASLQMPAMSSTEPFGLST